MTATLAPGPAGRAAVRPTWNGKAAAAALAMLSLAALTWVSLRAGSPDSSRWKLLALVGILWGLYGLAAALVLRAPTRAAVPLVVAGGMLLQVVAFTAAPQTTDDYYRYAWDGRVQAAGVNPYRYPPTAPELAPLRDDWLFPPGPGCADTGGRPACTRINHPDEPTIYPPLAQAYFLGLHRVSPAESREKPFQVAAALLAVATAVALLVVLRRSGGDPRLAVFWAWCPAVFLEAGNNAHVDVLGVLLVVVGLGAVAARRSLAGGALLGAAAAVKLLPGVVVPAALRRRPVAVVAASASVLVLAYLPHVLAVGSKVLGYLPGYLSEEGYGGTGRFALLRLVLADDVAPYVAVPLLVGAAFLAVRLADPDRPWRTALVLTGVVFLITGPSYPWYGLLVVALVALDGRWEWLAVAAASYPAYFAGALEVRHEHMQQWSYGLALFVVVGLTVARARKSAASVNPSRGDTPVSSLSNARPGAD